MGIGDAEYRNSINRLHKMCPHGSAALMAAQRLVSDSAYWYQHPNGPAKAPKHYERITRGRHGWELEFGANSFLVGKAIERCCFKVSSALEFARQRQQKVSAEELRYNLQICVRGAVANYAGDEYDTLWSVHQGHMLFGAQSIHVGEFVGSTWTLLQLGPVSKQCGLPQAGGL